MTDDMATRKAIECFQPMDSPPPAGHYSHGVRAGGFYFVSGQLPVDAQGKPRPELSFQDQVLLVLQRLDSALAAAGIDRQRLVQVRVYVTGIEHWPAFNTLYADWLGPHRPARAVVPVAELHHGCAIEIEAMAWTGH